MAPLTRVMTDSKDAELRRVARLRLARLLISQGKPDDALKTLAEDSWGAFASTAHEVRGDAFYAKHETKSALTEYQAALSQGQANGAEAALLQLKMADLAGPADAKAAPTTSSLKAAP